MKSFLETVNEKAKPFVGNDIHGNNIYSLLESGINTKGEVQNLIKTTKDIKKVLEQRILEQRISILKKVQQNYSILK